MEDIYVVEKSDSDTKVEVENLWQNLSEAEAYVEAKIGSDPSYSRNKTKEDDTIVRYWESGDNYICIRITVVD